MRRVLAGLVLASLLVPAGAAAQDSPAVQFANVVGGSDIGSALTAMAGNIAGEAERARVQAAIDHDRAALAVVVPDACVLPLYVGYLEVLTYADVALRLVSDLEITAATTVQSMISEKFASMDPNSLAACL